MNRTLYTIKNIKFNPSRNNVLSIEAKKRWNLNKSKHIIVRKFTSYSFEPPPPPNNFWEMVIIACGITIVQYIMRPPPPGGSSQIPSYNC